MNTATEISTPSLTVNTASDIPYLEGGFAGVVVSICLLLLRAVLLDWLRDQQMIREMLKKNETKE